MRLKSSLCKDSSSTLSGKRPWSSGIKSLGAETLNAPAAINKIWVVSITPHFVFTLLPSTIGKMSLWTPSRLTSWPWLSPWTAILSISSIKIIPLCSTRRFASSETLSWSIIFSKVSSVRIFLASFTVTERFLLFCKSSIEPPAIISMLGILFWRWTTISISRSSSFPSRNIWRNFSLVDLLRSSSAFSSSDNCWFAASWLLKLICSCKLPISWATLFKSIVISFSFSWVKNPIGLISVDDFLDFFSFEPGKSKSNNFSSTMLTDFSLSSSSISAFTSLNPTAIKSRIILSTSRPTYPTSVYFVASTFKKGAPHNFARRRAISVFPTPVGPIIKIFFGATSSRISSANFKRLNLFLKAIATAFFAFSWPIMYVSSFSTICFGVNSVFFNSAILFSQFQFLLQFFYNNIIICINTNTSCNVQWTFCNFFCT